MNSSHLEKILGRLDDLDPTNLTILVQRLVRERKLLETVFNTIREGVLVIDDTGLVEYCNSAAQGLFKLEDKDIGSETLWKYVPEFGQHFAKELGSQFADDAVISREIEIAYPEQYFVQVYLVPFYLPEPEVHRRYALIVSDITEDKVSTEAFIEGEKLNSIMLLAAGVAHELGNPLNSINIHLSLISRQLAKLEGEHIEKIKDSVGVCVNEVQRQDQIIKNFLQAIRPTPPNRTSINASEVIREVLHVLAKELENLNIHVTLDLGDEVPQIFADGNQLKQVFFNIIRNSSEAMDAGGEIKISARSDDESLYLYFADTGKGIVVEDLGKIFEPYFSTTQGGNGLGMMIVQRIMRDHGARIGIDSKVGVGTVVTLQFSRQRRNLRMLEADS